MRSLCQPRCFSLFAVSFDFICCPIRLSSPTLCTPTLQDHNACNLGYIGAMATLLLGSSMRLIANYGFQSQPHNHQDAPQTKQEKHTFVSTLAHRLPSTIPHKRKSVENSEASSVSSHIGLSIFRFTQPPSTPSPTPSLKALDNVTVVIPSPSQYQRKSMKASQPARPKYIGLSQECYPTELEEREKAALRTYPTARTVDRSVVPYSASSLQPLRNPSFTASQYLRTTLNTKFRRIEGPAISFDIDDEKLAMLSTNFGFIHEYKLQDGVTPVPDEFNGGCDCDGPCDPKGCGCLYSEVDSDERIVPYHSSEDGQIVLRPDFLHRKSMILECSFRCSCKGKCWNHVVQRGRSVRLQIFDTGPRGFGTFSILLSYVCTLLFLSVSIPFHLTSLCRDSSTLLFDIY